MFKTEQGASYGLNQVTVAKTDENVSLNAYVRSVSVLAAITITLSEAFLSPRIGDRHRVLATGGDANVLGGNYPLLGSGFVPQGSSADYELADSANGLVWVEMAGAGGIGTGEILVNKIIDVYNLRDVGLPANIYARPRSVDQPFELLKDSTIQADGITIVNVLSTGAGPAGVTALPGRWFRNETSVKRWTIDYLPENLPNGIQINADIGDNENDGFTPLTALKSMAEACRRLREMQAGKNYELKVLADIPDTDRWRPSFLQEANDEAIVVGPSGQTGVDQVFNMTVTGTKTDVSTGNLMVNNGTGNGYSITGTAYGGQKQQAFMTGPNLTTNVGQKIQITNAADPTLIGAIAFIGKDVSNTEAFLANTVRVSDFLKTDNTLAGAMPAGTEYKIVSQTKWNPSLIQTVSQGRFLIRDFDFTPPNGPAPAFQRLITFRFASVTFRGCLIRRNWDASNGFSNGLQACCFDYRASATRGIVSSSFAASVLAPTACLFLKADVRILEGGEATVNTCYLQDSYMTTVNTGAFLTFGFFNTAVGASGFGTVNVFGRGMTIYDWPVGVAGYPDAGLLVTDGAYVKFVSGDFLGHSTVNGSVGAIVRGNSTLAFANNTPSGPIVPEITGVDADVRINNPLGTAAGVDLAVRAVQAAGTNIMGIEAAGPVFLDAQTLQTWANWNDDPGAAGLTFGRYAFNPHDGSRVIGISQS